MNIINARINTEKSETNSQNTSKPIALSNNKKGQEATLQMSAFKLSKA